MENINRENWIDEIKGFGILMVVFSHISSIDFLSRFAFTFNVPIFFIISGFLLSKKKQVTYAKKTIIKLFIPYIFFSILCIILNVCIDYFVYHTLNISLYFSYFLRFITGYGILPLWFISSYIIGRAVFTFLLRFSVKKQVLFYIIIMTISFICSNIIVNNKFNLKIFERDTVLYYIFISIIRGAACSIYFWVGFYLVKKIYKIEKIKLIGISIILLMLDFILNSINEKPNFSMLDMGKYFGVIYLCGVSGSIGIIIIFYTIKNNISLNFLRFLGENSLIIMSTHMNFLLTVFSKKIIANVLSLSDSLVHNLIFDFCCLLMIIIIEIPIIYIINNCFPFIIGKSKKRLSQNC